MFHKTLSRWPQDRPVIALRNCGGHAVIALEFKEIPPSEALSLPLAKKASSLPTPSVAPAVVGIVGYDWSTNLDADAVRTFRINRAIAFEHSGDRIWECTRGCPPRQVAGRDLFPMIPGEEIRDEPCLNRGELRMTPHHNVRRYLRCAADALSDIRRGRYYQINLLRYFSLEGISRWQELLPYFQKNGGPHSALIAVPGLEVVSMSPERFVAVETDRSCRTYPIKGTIARQPDPVHDKAAIAMLTGSTKDKAELHMIIDLMRNDLAKVSEPGTIRVEDQGSVRSFTNVHHLQGTVRALLEEGLTIRDLLKAVCPAGSITGAPKIEVMRAIREYEGRSRRFFMGNIFYLDEHGRLDSSVLIRTVAKEYGNTYEFAAGSGIVIDSSAEQEAAEIAAKCRVLEDVRGAGLRQPFQESRA